MEEREGERRGREKEKGERGEEGKGKKGRGGERRKEGEGKGRVRHALALQFL